MKEFGFLFHRKENAQEGQRNCMNFNNWSDMEQAKGAAKMYLGMMRADYKRVSIFVKKDTMWLDSGEFVELSDL